MCRICGSNVDCGIAPIDKRIAFHEVDETVWLETNRHRLFIRELAAACGKSIGDSVFEVDEFCAVAVVRFGLNGVECAMTIAADIAGIDGNIDAV